MAIGCASAYLSTETGRPQEYDPSMTNQEEADKQDCLQPSPGERGDALIMLKEFARQGYERMMGTDRGFENLWRTAFNFGD